MTECCKCFYESVCLVAHSEDLSPDCARYKERINLLSLEQQGRLTYFLKGKWRTKINGVEFSGEAIDRLAAYENTNLTPDEIDYLKELHEYP